MKKYISELIGFISNTAQVVFIILKLCGLINWSWWWVMSPTLFSLAVVLIALAIAAIALKIQEKRKEKEWQEWLKSRKN